MPGPISLARPPACLASSPRRLVASPPRYPRLISHLPAIYPSLQTRRQRTRARRRMNHVATCPQQATRKAARPRSTSPPNTDPGLSLPLWLPGLATTMVRATQLCPERFLVPSRLYSNRPLARHRLPPWAFANSSSLTSPQITVASPNPQPRPLTSWIHD